MHGQDYYRCAYTCGAWASGSCPHAASASRDLVVLVGQLRLICKTSAFQLRLLPSEPLVILYVRPISVLLVAALYLIYYRTFLIVPRSGNSSFGVVPGRCSSCFPVGTQAGILHAVGCTVR
jgi:hypothetical protein